MSDFLSPSQRDFLKANHLDYSVPKDAPRQYSDAQKESFWNMFNFNNLKYV